MQQPTIYDVAKKAGVSIATVSGVINNNGKYSNKTKEKVLDVMEELKYYPSSVASSLTAKRTQTIGLIIPDISSPFYAEFARSLEDWGDEKGYSIIICSTDYNEKKEKKYVSLLLRRRVDGIIISSGFNNVDLIKDIIQQEIPVVLVAYNIDSLQLNTVSVDDYRGGYQATAYLAELGHKRIAIITETVQSSAERIRGYQNALNDYHLIYDENLLTESRATFEEGEIQAEKLLNLEEPPTAIFAFNDILAIGAMRAVLKRGLKIPEDISIVGFDNSVLATICNPTLTTMAQPLNDMGKEAIGSLISEIEGTVKRKQRILLLPELVKRHSTGPANLKSNKREVKN
ncbi:LacI family DNA-binding transcriptional regulator [Neobacillus mesonae]|uniref:LacI family DNA-binding transcriptional regulator n=1 Tax=Neobacillus mesonae TaxID=1193713 RepID=UPI0020415524|nr:LacI family DNA-binding transcriptional regulator [Neobacillus mesonae]MCM3569871.1 LacI family transcriptional regulator [Neobacillus mesonae]